MMFTQNMSIADIIMKDPRIINILERHGMHCNTCNAVFTGTLKDASRIHDININELLEELNSLITKV